MTRPHRADGGARRPQFRALGRVCQEPRGESPRAPTLAPWLSCRLRDGCLQAWRHDGNETNWCSDDVAGRSRGSLEALSEGIGRRDLLRVSAVIGAGAITPAWMLSPGVEDAFAAATRSGPGPSVLQSGHGRRPGHYVPSTPETVRSGFLPNRDSGPVRRVGSGSLVSFDTVSHEGDPGGPGSHPVHYFRHEGRP